MAQPIQVLSPDDLVFSPEHLATNFVRWAHTLINGKGVKWGIPAMDKLVLPAIAGDLVVLLARPGHAKTSVACYLARQEAERIVREGDPSKELVMYVSVEQPVEELEMFFQVSGEYSAAQLAWGKVPPEVIEKKALERVNLPVWMMGESVVEDRRHPRMTVANMYAALEDIRYKYHRVPTAVFIDYIQIVAVESYRDRISQVTEAVTRAKELAKRIRCPIFLCCQASRAVDAYTEDHFPRMDDGQWTSSLEQTADKIFGLWRPILTNRMDMKRKKPIKVNGVEYEINERLLLARMLKQRKYIGYKTWALEFTPEYAHLAQQEVDLHSGTMQKFEQMESREDVEHKEQMEMEDHAREDADADDSRPD